MDGSWLPRPPGTLQRAEITAGIAAFRAHLGRSLVDRGFLRRRTSWLRAHPDVTWVVKLERVFNGPSVAIRLGVFVPVVATTEPSMNACDVQLEWESIGVDPPAWAAGQRHAERGAYLGLALRFDSGTDMSERLAVADFAAEEISRLAERVHDLPTLTALLGDPPGGRAMLVTRRLREALRAAD